MLKNHWIISDVPVHWCYFCTGEAHRCWQRVHQLAAGVPWTTGQTDQVLCLSEVYHSTRVAQKQAGSLGNIHSDRVGPKDIQEGNFGQ